MKTRKLFLLGLLFLIFPLKQRAADFSLYDPVCEQMVNPIGIDTYSPRFSWKINARSRNFNQAAYQVLVASSEKLLAKDKGDIWDSRKIKDGQSVLIPFQGEKLRPATTYFWKVRIWDQDGKKSQWSTPQAFTTGLFNDKDWGEAKWIALEEDTDVQIPALHEHDANRAFKDKKVNRYKQPQFRKSLFIKKKPEQAIAYISGLGHFDLFLNGEKVGDHFLDPGWTKYDKEALYVSFDVTNLLQEGENVFGVMLGNGFYSIPNERYYKLVGSFGAPKMKFNLLIRYDDGSVVNVVSDKSWKVTESPITYSSIYGGEDYDATFYQKGWMLPGFPDKDWKDPIEISRQQNTVLRAQRNTHLNVNQAVPVVTCFQNEKGQWVYDLGQNFSGILRIKAKGGRGQSLILRPAELLNTDKTVNQSASGSPFYFKYTLKGTEEGETWQPQFTYYGFRYVQLEGAVPVGKENEEGLPEIAFLEGLHTSSAAPEAGSFQCSNPMFNKIYTLIDWAMRSNMASVLTDCPHREKLGWQEEAHLMQYSLQYRYDLSNLYEKIMNDLKASQLENGTVPTIAPEYVRFADGFEDTPEWGSAFVICPWYVYKWYGDRSLIDKFYPDMKRYVDYLGTRANNHIVAYGLGDWYDLGPKNPGYAQLTSNGVTATAIYYYDVTLLRDMAKLLGEEEDARQYETLASQIKKAYNEKFYNPDNGSYDRNSQTANAISLFMNLTDDENRERVLASLINDIRGRNNALTAGDIGYRYVLRTLEAAGKSDIIYDMNSKYDVPGYGWQLAHGATALTESWQAYGFVSNNHFMLGHLMEWLFSGLGGISQQENSVAFKQLLINPQQVGDVTSASTSYESPYGRISCQWKQEKEYYTLRTTIPANSQAIVCLPSDQLSNITEYGEPVEHKKDMKILDCINGTTRIAIGSGDYLFKVQTMK